MNDNIIGKYTLSSLKESMRLEFDTILPAEQFRYLKEINNGCRIILKNIEFNNAIAIIKELDTLDKQVNIVLPNISRKDYPYTEFKKINLNSVKITFVEGIDIFSLVDYIKQEEVLELMIRDIKDKNLSPLEKYMAIYEIVKKFKQFKRNNDDRDEARNIFKILFNDYIVCVGFSRLLIELLSRVGITATEMGTKVDISYDYGYVWDVKPVKLDDHFRVIVYLQDPKYNIDGYYMADPTWDNSLNKNLIVHSLMTFDMLQTQARLTDNTTENLILDNNNFNDFCTKINFFLKRRINNINKFDSYLNSLLKAYENLYEEIMRIIKLDKSNYEYFMSKYPKNNMNNEEQYNNFLTEVGHYIVSKTNKKVDVQKLFLATGEIYKQVLGMTDKEIKTIFSKMIIENKARYRKNFPYKMVQEHDFKLIKEDDGMFNITNPYKRK